MILNDLKPGGDPGFFMRGRGHRKFVSVMLSADMIFSPFRGFRLLVEIPENKTYHI